MTELTAPPPNSYDVIPYPSGTFRSTHPEMMATVGTLLGLNPPAVDQCRVLELGCSNAGNLIPMAYSLPGSQFVGLDLSARQIEMGQAALYDLGLTNVSLHQIDLLDVQDQFGHFDYIIAHGIYSWVPTPVQEKILSLCSQLLTDRGLAFVSYNTYPGWNIRGMIRQMMLFHVRNIADPVERINAAKSLLNFLTESTAASSVASLSATDSTAYASALRYEQALLSNYQESYIYHEHLEDINEPLYFTEFIRRAASHGLQYVTEADFVSAQSGNFPPNVVQAVQVLTSDLIETQQYFDFIANRTFRQTILCHDTAVINRSVLPQSLKSFYVAGLLQSASNPIVLSASHPEVFTAHTGKTITVEAPILKAALAHLGQNWPKYIPFDALLAAAHEQLAPGVPHVYSVQRLNDDVQLLGSTLLYCFANGLVELHTFPALFRTEVSARPTASLVARWQSRTAKTVANLRHETIELDDISRAIIAYLDGSHDHAFLFNILDKQARDGAFILQSSDGKPVETDEARNLLLAESLNQSLNRLAGSGLLVD